jgi:hypothetical protein
VGVLAPLDEVGELDELAELPDIGPEPPETPTDPVEAVAASPGELNVCTPLPTVPVQATSSEDRPQTLAAARLGLKMRVFIGVESLIRNVIVAARRPWRSPDWWERGEPWITNSRPDSRSSPCARSVLAPVAGSGIATRKAAHALRVEDDVVVVQIEGFVWMPIVKAKSEDRVAAD